MLYSSNRWQSTIKFVSIKTCLFVQEYKYRLVCIKSTLDITHLSIKTHFSFCFSLTFFTHTLSLFYFHFLFSFDSLFSFFTLFLVIFFWTLGLTIFFNLFSLFNFIWSSYTCLVVNGTRVMVLLSLQKNTYSWTHHDWHSYQIATTCLIICNLHALEQHHKVLHPCTSQLKRN